MKITSESAILGICLIILAYEVFLLKSRDEEIIAECKADYKILHTEIDVLRETSTAATASRNLENLPFTCDDRKCTADIEKLFIFPKGVLIGLENADCNYGDHILSVDATGSNCPSGIGSVTFGRINEATGMFGSVTGGEKNKASGKFASVSGGFTNSATGYKSSISGGRDNEAKDIYTSVTGGEGNTASGKYASVSGGGGNEAKDTYTSVTGGEGNTASGKYASVSGGNKNNAKGDKSSISGGDNNEALGKRSSILGGSKNKISEVNEIFPVTPVTPVHPFTCVDGWCTSIDYHFLFPKGIVVGYKKPLCNYGNGTLSVDSGRTDKDNKVVGSNCPKGSGSVTFGRKNQATGISSSVLGGSNKHAIANEKPILGVNSWYELEKTFYSL